MRADFHAFAFATLLCCAGSAMAATSLTQTVTTNLPAAATGSAFNVAAGAGQTVITNPDTSNLPVVSLSKFNPNTGILIGARVSASVPVFVASTVSATGPTSGSRRVDGTAVYTAGISAPGLAVTGTTAVTAAASCSGGNCLNGVANNTTTSSTTTFGGSGAVNSGSLSTYYSSSGTVDVATAGTLRITTVAGASTQGANTQVIVNRGPNASYSVTYDYLNFAQPSFDANSVLTTTTLNFGKVRVGTAPITLNFTLHNIGNANSAGLDLLSVTPDRAPSLFSTTLLPFSGQAGNIDGGQSRSYQVSFNPSVLGYKINTFRLQLADSAADVGDGVGARTYAMALNVEGLVLPEPGTWATMIVGFGLIGAVMRRRRVVALPA